MQCWFCSLREAETEYAYNFDMYGKVDAQNNISQTNVSYNVRHIQIPRCSDCYNRHKTAKFAKIMSIIFGFLFIGTIIILMFSLLDSLPAGILCGLAAGLIVASLLSNRLIQKGIFTIRNSRSEYPPVKELLTQCYRFGVRPKSPIPQSDPPCDPDTEKDKKQDN